MHRTQHITVYLADDHQIVLRGIASLVDLEPDLHVVGCTTESAQVIPDLLRLRPQVLVLDLGMPDIPGAEIIRRIKARRTINTEIVVFTMHKDLGYVVQALEDGALGYVMKDVDSIHLVEAIRQVAQGQQYLSPPFTQETLWEYKEQLRLSKGELDSYESLTDREKEILLFVAQGLTNRQIADKLGVSVRTVETHRYNMRKKTGFKNKAEIIQYALRKGLIIPADSDENLLHEVK